MATDRSPCALDYTRGNERGPSVREAARCTTARPRAFAQREIERGERKGKINPEGRDPKHPPAEVDVETAIATVLEAFVDGLYLVVIDEVEYTDLDAIVSLKCDSRVTFIRLTFLAGA